MHKYSKSIFLLLTFSLFVGLSRPVFTQANGSEARKVDDFGDAQLSDIAARLDNFATQLQQEPQSHGFLIVYRSRRDLPGLSSRLVNWMKNYLVNSRGFSSDTIVAIDGGVAGAVAQELWIVPPGTAPKPRADAYARQLEDTTAVRKFDEGPYLGRGGLPESYYHDVRDSLEGFAEALRKEPKTSGYLIGYAEYRIEEWDEMNDQGRKRFHHRVFLDRAGTAASELKTIRAALRRDYGIPALRLKLINGGYRKTRNVELWIVPPGEHAPIATPNAFPKRRR